MLRRPAADQRLKSFWAVERIYDVRKIQQALGGSCCDNLSPCAKEHRWVTNFVPILSWALVVRRDGTIRALTFGLCKMETDRSG
jgi:hypothetical protein